MPIGCKFYTCSVCIGRNRLYTLRNRKETKLMSKIAVVTDSNSGITQDLAEKIGIYVIPMPFVIDGKEYFEGINLTQEQFFEMLKSDVTITTSQPAVKDVTEMWDKLFKTYDEIVHIPMSSGLSSSYATAEMLSRDYDGRVQVVNNHRISVTLRRSIDDALRLAEKGKDAKYIKDVLTKTAKESSIYITLATLKYLKKGGRLTPAAAAIGAILRIKPVLQIQGERLDAYAKSRTMKSAKEIMLKAIRSDMDTRMGEDVYVDIAHTDNYEEALKFKEEAMKEYPWVKDEDIRIDALSLGVACHLGEGALAITCTKKQHF